MSHQKHHVSAKDLQRNAAQKHRKKQNVNYHVNFCEYDADEEKPNKRRHKRQEIQNGDDSSSSETKKHERPRRRKHHRKSDPSEIHILKQKLEEIDTLREQIEVFQSIISSQDDCTRHQASEHKNVKWITSSCFSFLSALTCKKSRPEIVEVYGNSSKLKHDPDGYVLGKDVSNKRRQKNTKHRKNRELVRQDKEHDLARHHRITNNNTIVLLENYGLSPQHSGDQSLMNNLNQKLEAQVHEIKEIKDTLKECISLLKESGIAEGNRCRPNFNYLLDEYIKLNRIVPSKFDSYYPNGYKEDGLLSLLNSNVDKRFDKTSTECTSTPMQIKPIIKSVESLDLSKKISKTSVSTSNENKFPESICEVYCNKDKKPQMHGDVILKVSPLKCGKNIRCHKPPKSVSMSLSSFTVVEASRRRSKKINRKQGKSVKPVTYSKKRPDSECECKMHQGPKKRSCFSRFIRFIFCRCNK